MVAIACLSSGCVHDRQVRGPVDAATAEQMREQFDGRKVIVTLRLPPRQVVKGVAEFRDGAGLEVVRPGQTRLLDFGEIEEMRTSRRGEAIGWGTLLGSLAGVAVGGLVGYYFELCTPTGYAAICADGPYGMLFGALTGGGAGAATGFIVGSIVGRGPVWRFD